MLRRHVCSSASSSKPIAIRTATGSHSLKPTLQPIQPLSQPRRTISNSKPTLADYASRRSPALSDLGLRSNRPPDSYPEPTEQTPPEIPDHEWELRTGRAIFVIRETLPDFFRTGLITAVDKATGSPRQASILSPTTNINFLEPLIVLHDDEPIYSSKLHFSYTPPVLLPPPFPKTLQLDGLQLYTATSSLIRHTMNALYSDLALHLVRFTINTPRRAASTDEPATQPQTNQKQRVTRDKSILIRQTISGVSRVTGKMGEWEVESTYTFSPSTGLIHRHVIDSIYPAPHQAVYDSLRMSLGKLGWSDGTEGNAAGGAACRVKLAGLK